MDYMYRYGGYVKEKKRFPMFEEDSVQAKAFLALFKDNPFEKKIMECLYIRGYTFAETSEIVSYSERQVYRIAKKLIENKIIKLWIEKNTPKAPVVEKQRYGDKNKGYTAKTLYLCPNCLKELGCRPMEIRPFCSECGQAIIIDEEDEKNESI